MGQPDLVFFVLYVLCVDALPTPLSLPAMFPEMEIAHVVFHDQ